MPRLKIWYLRPLIKSLNWAPSNDLRICLSQYKSNSIVNSVLTLKLGSIKWFINVMSKLKSNEVENRALIRKLDSINGLPSDHLNPTS